MVALRWDPRKPDPVAYAVVDDGHGQWCVQYGQPGPPGVIAACFDTEDEAWEHAEDHGLSRPDSRYPVTGADSE